MSVELKKFQERYKKIEDRVKPCLKDSASKIMNRLEKTEATDGAGLDGLRDAITQAINSGKKGKSVVDFSTDKDVKLYISGLKDVVDEVEKEVEAIKTLSEDAAKVEVELKSIADDIAKDLKDRSKLFSGSRKDIEKLQTKIAGELRELAETKTYYDKKLNGRHKRYRESMLERMDKMYDQALDRGNSELELIKTDALLKDRKVAQNAVLARDLADKVIEACKQAEGATKDGPKGAAPFLKQAQTSFGELVQLDKLYQQLLKENEDAIKSGLGPEKILGPIEKINRAKVAADKQLKLTMQAIRELMK